MRIQQTRDPHAQQQFWRRLALVVAIATGFVVVIVLLMISLFG